MTLKDSSLLFVMLLAASAVALVACSGNAGADDKVPPEIAKRLADSISGVTPEQVKPAPMKGWYQISNGPAYGYISEDGRYLIEGDLIDLETDTNLSEQQRQQDRIKAIAEIEPGQMITFSPGEPKHLVTVFTDVDCGYCRRLHQQISEYNDKGIGIRYVFFPTAGPGSKAYKRAESVWCADDPRAAMTAAKAGQQLPAGNCKNPVQQQYLTAMQVGVRGTPAIITEAGRLIGGYKPPETLLNDLNSRP